MIKRNKNADVYAYQVKATKDKFTKIEVRISELNASVDPLTVAGISAYQRQIDRVIGHLTVKTKEIIEQVASNANGHSNRHDNISSLNPIAENGDTDNSEDDSQDAKFFNQAPASAINGKKSDAPEKVSQQLSVQINILDKAILLALVPTNTFNASKLEKI